MQAQNLLKQQYPEMARLLSELNPLSLLRVAGDISQLAIHERNIRSSVISEALAHLGKKEYGNQEIDQKLEQLSQKIEDPYLNELSQDRDNGLSPDSIDLFKNARSVDALRYALEGNSQAAYRAVYEAVNSGLGSAKITEKIKNLA